MKKLNLVYFGTPEFSAQLLEKIIVETRHASSLPIEIKFVVTQPDKPVGRKQILTPSPVKLMAEKYKLPVLTSSLKIGDLKNLFSNIDIALLYAYGKIIPQDILSQPKFGFWNIHPSLLPKYRGASPIAFPLINGDQKTGVTLMQMDQELDHGPIIDQEELIINFDDKRPDLESKLTDLGFQLFVQLIKRLDNIKPREQDHAQATYTKLLKKQDGFISFENLKFQITNSPEKLFNLFRGLYPWPGIWSKVIINQQEKRLKILDLQFQNDQLIIKQVQLEGKNPVDFKTFSKAYNLS